MKPIDNNALVLEFTAKMAELHPELAKPVVWTGFTAMAARCGITIRVLPLPQPARLLRLGKRVGIQIKRGMHRTLQTRYGMHEMWHFWNDDIGESCIYADDETVRHPREDAADLFAWYVTSPARIFLEPRPILLKKASELVPDLSSLYVAGDCNFPLGAVGESFCQSALESICGPRVPDGHQVPAAATLICENDNRYDAKAVRVEMRGQRVGYLSREHARLYRRKYGHRTVHCAGLIVGGWDRGGGDAGHFGVRLDLRLTLGGQ